MALFASPTEHAENPPNTWRIVNLGRRHWSLQTKDGTVLNHFDRKRDAEDWKAPDGWGGHLYELETRWYAGEAIKGWKPYETTASRERHERRAALYATPKETTVTTNSPPADIDYAAACDRATTAQGLDPLVDALTLADLDHEVEQTGGFTMVVTRKVSDGVWGMTWDDDAWLVIFYPGDTWHTGGGDDASDEMIHLLRRLDQVVDRVRS